MANEFYNRGATFNPDELADGDAIEAEFDAVARGFDTIGTNVDANKAGYPTQTFHVAPATEATHAARKEQLDTHINDQSAVHGATSVNAPGKLVARDENGDVAARTFVGDLLGVASSARVVSDTAPTGEGRDLVYGAVAGNDFFRLRISAPGTDDSEVELATSDNGNEPIHVRQYTGVFANVARTLTLLDGNGNTIIPGITYGPSFTVDDHCSGLHLGNGDSATSTVNNVKIASWYGVGFSPSVSGQPVPYGEYSHWFNTRNGDMGCRGTITAPRLAGNADTATMANGASGSTFFTTESGAEGRIGARCAGYYPAYLYNNNNEWGAYSADGGHAFNFTRGVGFRFYGHANSAAQAVAEASGYWDAVDLAYARMAGGDYFRLRAYGSGYDQGAVEIATADGGNEPIYVRQYTGEFTNIVRTLTLLDGNGNTVIPGNLYLYGGIALVEYGSNGSGEYYRFADGTQICSRVVSADEQYPVEHSFAAAFVTVPITIISNDSAFAAYASSVNVVTWKFAFYSSTTSYSVRVIAIGRWK